MARCTVEQGFKKAKKVINRMIESRDLEDIKETVKITDALSLEINCIRADVGMPDYIGMAIAFEIYAMKNNKAVDCVTVDVDDSMNEDICYLLKCYI